MLTAATTRPRDTQRDTAGKVEAGEITGWIRMKPAITLPVMRRYRIDKQNYPQKELRNGNGRKFNQRRI
jgi:hypothetical protein